MSRILAELTLGIRLALAGGRTGWLRTAMAVSGVAIGAAALLLAASVPGMLDARHARTDARGDLMMGGSEVLAGRTVVVAAVESEFQGADVRGRLIWPEAPDAPLPPGVPAFPGEHQMYASPALQAALTGPDGAELRRQMPYQVIGTIAPEGLAGPKEFAYYTGYRRVVDLVGRGSTRVDRFGYAPEEVGASPFVAVVTLLLMVLLPIGIFVAAALRFGAETRDRRLAAIRLVGADRRAVLRIACGESLVVAGSGLLLGTVLYLLARARTADFELFGVSAYPADVRPSPVLTVGVVLLVVGLSAGMTLLGFRGVAVEPLGVFRDARPWRGRLWWRLILPAMSALLLYPAVLGTGKVGENRTGAGIVLLVVGLIPLLPYLIPLTSRLLPDGPPSWQLAVQQLRRNPTASTRSVTGIIVAVVGAIALQTMFAGAVTTGPDDPADPAFTLQTTDRQTPADMRQRSALFERVGGVTAGTVSRYRLFSGNDYAGGYLIVGDCAALRQVAALDRCADGDAFTVGQVGRSVTLSVGDEEPVAGARIPVPRSARPTKLIGSGTEYEKQAVLLTPAAAAPVPAEADPSFVTTSVFTTVPPASVEGRLRGIAAEIDPLARFNTLVSTGDKWAPLRTAVNIGSALILFLMGVGLLLDVAARLHDRRRLLGVLAAVGARRSTVVWSVLLQAIVPVVTGMVPAIAVGAGVGALLLRMGERPIRFSAAAIAVPAATGTALVLVTTVAVLLPAARRVTRTEQLRYE